ncbi:DNA topoisomerase III [Bacillus massilinigeriensis]|uniref:DNA topoisomerase III n=1 Tax=Bacillus mediterraneensis TaxID=1805474 RepID=UPI0008F93018|nr:DNA topoisomerase III [Bacillus mediterraneensis]
MKLIIAEKPDQGRTLASVFGMKKREGFLEILPNNTFPDGAYVTWAVGHLTELASPEKYNASWKKWSLDSLPLIPSKFQYEVVKGKAKQYTIIKKLASDSSVDEIIHAGDAGREGELIIRNILRLTGCKKPMKRLWISSLTPKAIKEGFQNLLKENETRNLYFEAYTRACADWVVGMNASRLYTILLKNKGFADVFSVGRVQTPTLALIVKREMEIENFVSEPFWEVEAKFKIKGKGYTGKWEKEGESRIKTEELAKKIAVFCTDKPAEVSNIKAEKKEFLPPLFYNLSALQAEANRRFKFPPKKTLDVLQGLYQRGFVSYPRSDSRHVTPGEAAMFPAILEKLQQQSQYKEFFPLPIQSINHNKRYVNEKKVTDHYAIIPTEQVPNVDKLSGDERKLYDLLARTLIAAHFGKSVIEFTTITTLVDQRAEFISKGKVMVKEGWKKVLPQKDSDKEEILPQLEKGEHGTTVKVNTRESKTQPPKRYTEGQLITLMKTAGKHVEDKDLEKVLMKTEGLGTEATRAGIITMLKDRNYIEIRKNLVYATAKAKILVQSLGTVILASPGMTAKWEQRLKEIGEGQASPKQFMDATKKMVGHLVAETVKEAEAWSFDETVSNSFVPGKRKGKSGIRAIGTCKKCGGKIIDKGSFYGCSNYVKNQCSFTISKKILGVSMNQKILKELLSKGETEVMEFKGKDGNSFTAKLAWSEEEQKFKFLHAVR